MRYFIFNIIEKEGKNCTVIYNFSLEFSKILLRQEVIDFHTDNAVCHDIIYIAPHLKTNDNETLKDLIDIFQISKENIFLVCFDTSGFINPAYSNLPLELNKIKYYGLLHIVNKRKAVLEGDDTFHYVLPSQKHSPFLIRTGNILQNDNEICFIAFCLLDELNGVIIKHICCDTSSIISIAYAYLSLKALFHKMEYTSIKSFGSYHNLNEFDFRPRSLVLISASNSGNLEKKYYNQHKSVI